MPKIKITEEDIRLAYKYLKPDELKVFEADLMKYLRSIPNLIQWGIEHCPERLGTYNPNTPSRGFSQFHIDVARSMDELVELRGQRRYYIAPRNSAKSTWGMILDTLRESLEGREQYTILIGDTQTNVRRFLAIIKREIEGNPLLRAAYPKTARVGPVWHQDGIVLPNGCEIEAISTNAAIRGRLGKTRPTRIKADDLQGKDDIISGIERQRAWEWFTNDLLPIGEPTTNIDVFGTAIHRDSIVYKLRETAGWETTAPKDTGHVYKAINSFPDNSALWDRWEQMLHNNDDPVRMESAKQFYLANKDAMDAGASVLWPERFPLYDLMLLLATMGLNAFRSEYQNDPTNPELLEWPAEYFDDTTRPEFWFDDWEEIRAHGIQLRVLALDPSKGRKDGMGDYSCFILYARDSRGVEWVEADMFRGSDKATVTNIIERGCRHVDEFKPDAFGYEAVAFQSLFGTLFEQEFQRRHLSVHMVPIQSTTDKHVRIKGTLTGPLAQRKFRFRRTKGTKELVAQLRDFPTHEHDDGPDCLALGRQLAIDLFNVRKRNERQALIQYQA